MSNSGDCGYNSLKGLSLRANVTCFLSIDDHMDSIYYGNDDVGWHTIIDSTPGITWDVGYSFNFTDKGPKYHLKISGHERTHRDGCQHGGLAMECKTSSPSKWNGFASTFNTEHWVRSVQA